MTDKVQEGAPVTPEPVVEKQQVAEPAPNVSEVTPEVQQPSVPAGGITEDRLLELLAKDREELKAELGGEIERGIQSMKDRRFGKLETKVDEALAIKEQVEAAGGWDQFLSQRRQADDMQAMLESMINARIPQTAVSAQERWNDEWATESQKILDNAAKIGIDLTPEEVNTVKFNNGIPFKTKGDAYSALNNAIIAKARGETISIAAVATEGGEVASPPAPPPGPKTFRQELNEAQGDAVAERSVLDKKWDEIEKAQRRLAIKAELEAKGISPEELIGE
jgi:hypothetical protein